MVRTLLSSKSRTSVSLSLFGADFRFFWPVCGRPSRFDIKYEWLTSSVYYFTVPQKSVIHPSRQNKQTNRKRSQCNSLFANSFLQHFPPLNPWKQKSNFNLVSLQPHPSSSLHNGYHAVKCGVEIAQCCQTQDEISLELMVNNWCTVKLQHQQQP